MAQTSDSHKGIGAAAREPIDGNVAVMFLRLRQVLHITGLSRSTLYRLIAVGSFPRPVRIAPRAVAWRRSDIDVWGEARSVAMH
jgi:prophage regulatory protein